jgi:hypothetical protein
MTEFDYEVRSRKALVPSARHKKASSLGPRGCSLPSDNLTPAEWKKKNSGVETYRLDRPMDWRTFKSLPEDLQVKYLRDMQVLHGATDVMLSKMFGVHAQTVLTTRKELGVKSLGKGGHKGQAYEKLLTLWDEFLAGDASAEEFDEVSVAELETVAEPEESVAEETEGMNLSTRGTCPRENIGETPDRTLWMNNFTTTISGYYSPSAMSAILGAMPIPEGKVTIRIEVTSCE